MEKGFTWPGWRLDHDEVRSGPLHHAAVDAFVHGETAHAVTDLVDDAGEVVAESGWDGDVEPGGELRRRRDSRVHGVEADGCDVNADFARAGVRLRNVLQFQNLGASELLVDDSSTHGVDLQ